ncbi:MAG: protein-L-isoaspartate O-methyltransferase [Bacteroidetes bacterium]|nr:protein-L-isoaspartate O-methyltransferase [Bacteroidota bacterium]
MTCPYYSNFYFSFEHFAYEDKAFPIDRDQTISQPYTVAFQTQLLSIQKTDKVLEIGTGSGYQCAILCELSDEVYSIEIHELLHKKAMKLLNSLGYQPTLSYGNGYLGLPTKAPFDKIIVTAGAEEIPQALLAQLKIGGVLVIPVGQDDNLEMLKITRVSENKFERSKHGLFKFVPFVKE